MILDERQPESRTARPPPLVRRRDGPILVFVEHDIIARHFLMSRVFDALAARYEVVFVFPDANQRRLTVNPETLDLPARFLRIPVDPIRQFRWRLLFIADLLRWRRDPDWRALRRRRRHLLGWKGALQMSVLAMPGIFQAFKRWTMAEIAKRPPSALITLFDELAPRAIVHPSVLEGLFINDLIALGRERRLPTVVAMNSWDNPSTKRAVYGLPDWLLVWGPQTRRQAIRFMGMPDDRTVAFGAAQFDVYRDPPRVNRIDFARRHGINPAFPIVLYAGSSKQADEYDHLIKLDAAIESGVLPPMSVVYRPHPWGQGGRGGARILDEKWRHVAIENTMRVYLERVAAGDDSFFLPDYCDTHDTLSSVDALMSPLSTILIEAALHGKPPMCVLPTDDPAAANFHISIGSAHFRDLLQNPDFLLARGSAEMISRLPELLARALDPVVRARLTEEAKEFVTPFDRPWGERFADFLEAKVLAGASSS